MCRMPFSDHPKNQSRGLLVQFHVGHDSSQCLRRFREGRLLLSHVNLHICPDVGPGTPVPRSNLGTFTAGRRLRRCVNDLLTPRLSGQNRRASAARGQVASSIRASSHLAVMRQQTKKTPARLPRPTWNTMSPAPATSASLRLASPYFDPA